MFKLRVVYIDPEGETTVKIHFAETLEDIDDILKLYKSDSISLNCPLLSHSIKEITEEQYLREIY